MTSDEMMNKFPVGALVSPQVDASTLEVLPQYSSATHVVIGHSEYGCRWQGACMLRVFPLGLPFREGRESMMHPERAVIREKVPAWTIRSLLKEALVEGDQLVHLSKDKEHTLCGKPVVGFNDTEETVSVTCKTCDGLVIREGDRIQVFEGSWMGKVGVVLIPDAQPAGHTLVQFDGEDEPRLVITCTLGEEEPD